MSHIGPSREYPFVVSPDRFDAGRGREVLLIGAGSQNVRAFDTPRTAVSKC